MSGIIKRVPRELLDELNQVKIERAKDRDVDAFREMAKLSRAGRELVKFDFFYPMKKRRR